jgi:hypothetical protein
VRKEELMGLFGKLFGRGVDKDTLTRQLVEIRVSNDPVALSMEFNKKMIKSLSTVQLASIPEGTIVAIVETWSLLKNQRFSDEEIIDRIEAHRSRFYPPGDPPQPLTLTNYIKYRIRLEHTDGAPIDDSFIEAAVEMAKIAFGY